MDERIGVGDIGYGITAPLRVTWTKWGPKGNSTQREGRIAGGAYVLEKEC